MLPEALISDLSLYFQKNSLNPKELYQALCSKWVDTEAGYEFKLTHREAASLVADLISCDYTDLYMSGNEGKVSLLLQSLFAKYHLIPR